MKNKNEATQTKLTILRAANALILSRGVAHLTLEAVAQAAQISKGGLLYHFPTKEALIEGLVQHLTTDFNRDIEQQFLTNANSGDQAAPGSWLRAYLRASFLPCNSASELNEISAGLLAAIAINPALLAPIRQSYQEWQTHIEQDGLDPALATIIRLATDGLWLAELLDLAAPGEALRDQILARLIELTQNN